jgi:hypothetical protein
MGPVESDLLIVEPGRWVRADAEHRFQRLSKRVPTRTTRTRRGTQVWGELPPLVSILFVYNMNMIIFALAVSSISGS